MALKSQLTIELEPTSNDSTADSNEGETDETTAKSEIAEELSSLKNSVTKAINERSRLPQPLFWSLFNSKIKELRERKERSRRLEELLSKLD